jgi:CubicO group peptidase (beta-lactamase class C family)
LTIEAVLDLVDQQRAEGLHPGAQLYVSHRGDVLCDTAVGQAGEGAPLTPDHIMLLYSAGKPLTTVAVLQLVERGDVRLDDPIGRFVPAWGAGKERCTVRHVLTHMGGFATCELFDHDITYQEAIERIAAWPAEYEPGTKAGYHPSSGWKVLGEVVRVVDGRPIDRYLDEMVCQPLGLTSTFLGIPPERQPELASRLCPVHWTGYTLPVRTDDGGWLMAPYRADHVHNERWWLAKVEPGGSLRGPAHDLGRFYQALLDGGPGLFANPVMVDLMAATHRRGIRDRTFLSTLPWGLGVNVAGGISGSRVGYRVFGHGGMATSRAFCDPVEGLVCVYVTNGLAPLLDHERRMTDLTEAVYEAVANRV